MAIKKSKQAVSRFRTWLFEVGTRVVEIISGVMMIGFGTTMLLEHGRLTQQEIYANFEHPLTVWAWAIMIVLGVCQLIAASGKTIKSNIASGLILILSSLVWFVITVRFGLAFPPISTALTTYFIITIATGLAGHEVVTVNKQREQAHGDK